MVGSMKKGFGATAIGGVAVRVLASSAAAQMVVGVPRRASVRG